MDVSKDLVAASATPLILAILKQHDSYGYEIIRRIREASNDKIIWSEGMLYPVLHRLEKNGFVDSYWRKAETGRKRKYYSLNAEGLLELENHTRQWEVVHSTLTATIRDSNREKGEHDV